MRRRRRWISVATFGTQRFRSNELYNATATASSLPVTCSLPETGLVLLLLLLGSFTSVCRFSFAFVGVVALASDSKLRLSGSKT
jgi:hypothetical protein